MQCILSFQENFLVIKNARHPFTKNKKCHTHGRLTSLAHKTTGDILRFFDGLPYYINQIQTGPKFSIIKHTPHQVHNIFKTHGHISF